MTTVRDGHEKRVYLNAVLGSVLLTGSRVVSALVVNKIIAAYLGPGGLAIVGQFQNLTAVAFGLSSGNASSAVIATVSRASDEADRRRAISTASVTATVATGIAACLVALLAQKGAGWAFGDASLSAALLFFALLMVPLILNVVLLAVIAGLGRGGAFVAINAGIAIASMPICWFMVNGQGLLGALLTAVIANSVALLVTVAWVLRTQLFPIRWLWAGADGPTARRLARLALMTLSTITAVPVAQILVRQQIVEGWGAEVAGQWQAALKMGEILLMGASVVVSLHFLPRFGRARAALLGIVRPAVGMMVVGLGLTGFAVALVGHVVLPVLFSVEFAAAADLLPVQMAADALRGGAILVQAAFLARACMLSYVLVDLVYATVMVIVGSIVIPHFGAHGATDAVLSASIAALSVALMLLRRTSVDPAE